MNKRSKTILFKINGRRIESIDGEDITFDEAEKMKTNLAIIHNVSYDEVEIDTENGEELSTTAAVNDSGKLIFRADNPNSLWRLTEGLQASYDIRHDELVDEWLAVLGEQGIDKAIIFN